jgi:hypothetical protein
MNNAEVPFTVISDGLQSMAGMVKEAVVPSASEIGCSRPGTDAPLVEIASNILIPKTREVSQFSVNRYAVPRIFKLTTQSNHWVSPSIFSADLYTTTKVVS